jgi:hypothetical protein
VSLLWPFDQQFAKSASHGESPSDLLFNLKLDDLHWASATLEIEQSKTGTPLVLPISEEVPARATANMPCISMQEAKLPSV